MKLFLELTLIDRYPFASSKEVLINIHQIVAMHRFNDEDGQGTAMTLTSNKEIKVKESFENIRSLIRQYSVK